LTFAVTLGAHDANVNANRPQTRPVAGGETHIERRQWEPTAGTGTVSPCAGAIKDGHDKQKGGNTQILLVFFVEVFGLARREGLEPPTF
jgi:hypothetical protein